MLSAIAKFLPAGALGAGALATAMIGTPQPTPLRQPLATVAPAEFLGMKGTDVKIEADEVDKSGVSDYLNRVYAVDAVNGVGLYVGYHATQQGDKRMHSPTLCLPGSGWTPIGEQVVPINVGGKKIDVNRFILQNSASRILVYYWFQGRGRITSGQGTLKLNAMKDALLTHRDEEALVRVIVPLGKTDDAILPKLGMAPDSVAVRLAEQIIDPLTVALPAAP